MKVINSRGRFTIGAAVPTAAAVVALPAHDASARGGGWQFLDFPEYDTTCGQALVHASAVSREYFRDAKPLPDGTISYQVTGSLRVTYTAENGKTVSVNSSGPGHLLIHPDEDVQVQAQGTRTRTRSPSRAGGRSVFPRSR